jgi:hypothetical protein
LLLEQPNVMLRRAGLAAAYLAAWADPACCDAAGEALGEPVHNLGLRRLLERLSPPGSH